MCKVRKSLHKDAQDIFNSGIKGVDQPHGAGQEEPELTKAGIGSAELSLRQIAVAALGISAATACVGWLTSASNAVLVSGSFGSSCVLLFAYPYSPFSRARNFVGGHFVCSLVGLLFLKFVGPAWWSMALATGTAFAAMMLTRTIHPPAGSNPVIVYLLSANWNFLWFPTLAGALAIQLIVLAHHSSLRRMRLQQGQMPRGRGVRGRRMFGLELLTQAGRIFEKGR